MEQAKSHGQHVDGSAPDGTYAAGVYRVTELLPVLMNDIIQLGQKVSTNLEMLESAAPVSIPISQPVVVIANLGVLQAEHLPSLLLPFCLALTQEKNKSGTNKDSETLTHNISSAPVPALNHLLPTTRQLLLEEHPTYNLSRLVGQNHQVARHLGEGSYLSTCNDRGLPREVEIYTRTEYVLFST